MIKIKNQNTIDINVIQEKTEESQIPVHIKRGVGSTAVWPRRQDHGTRGNSECDDDKSYLRGNKQELLEEAHDGDIDDALIAFFEDNDFDRWEEQIKEKPSLEDDVETEWSTETPPKNSGNKSVIDWDSIMSDLQAAVLTKNAIKNMNDDEKEALRQWLHKRAKKS